LQCTASLKTLKIDDFIKDINPSVNVKAVQSDTPETQVWSITADIEAANGANSTFLKTVLGFPQNAIRWFALVRLWTPWLAPRQGQSSLELDKDALLCSFLRSDGLNLTLLALSGIDDIRTLFQSDENGNITISVRNDSPRKGIARIIASVGKDFESANAAAVYRARTIMREYGGMDEELRKEVKSLIENDMRPEWMENWYDGLSYCTWNGLGQTLTETKILDALESLERNNIKSQSFNRLCKHGKLT
jgi:hypothetical protein